MRLLTKLFRGLSGSAVPPPGVAITISTVDGFQGREADIVIFSAVRSNPQGRIGFVADARRLNVAITRARRGLVVLGNGETLRHDANWRAWLSWVTERMMPPQQRSQQLPPTEQQQQPCQQQALQQPSQPLPPLPPPPPPPPQQQEQQLQRPAHQQPPLGSPQQLPEQARNVAAAVGSDLEPTTVEKIGA